MSHLPFACKWQNRFWDSEPIISHFPSNKGGTLDIQISHSFLELQLVLMHTQLCSCIRRLVLEALRTWVLAYICGVLSTYVGLDPHTWDNWQRPYSAHFHFFFHCFTSICNLTPFFVIFGFEHHCILLFIFILALKTPSFIIFTWIKNLTGSNHNSKVLKLLWNQYWKMAFAHCFYHNFWSTKELLVRFI